MDKKKALGDISALYVHHIIYRGFKELPAKHSSVAFSKPFEFTNTFISFLYEIFMLINI